MTYLDLGADPEILKGGHLTDLPFKGGHHSDSGVE